MKVLAFGEILWDIIEGVEHLGGAPFNFAAHSAQCGNQSFIISRLGNDKRGEEAFNQCKIHGVDNSLIQWDDKNPTGYVDVTLTNGQPDYVIIPHVAYDFIETDVAFDKIQKHAFDIFYFGSLVQRHPVSAKAVRTILEKINFKHIFYDVNLRKDCYTDEIIKSSLKSCTIFKLNSDEVPVISKLLTGVELSNEKFCQALQAQYKNIVTIVVTASDQGCFIYDQGRLVHIHARAVTVVDAVGAGDAFSASFMHGFATSGDAISAAKIGNQVGAFVATQAGAIPEYSPEIKQMLKQ